MTGGTVELAFVDQGCTGVAAAEQASGHGVKLEVIKHTEAKRGFVLLPRRWVVERNTCRRTIGRQLAVAAAIAGRS